MSYTRAARRCSQLFSFSCMLLTAKLHAQDAKQAQPARSTASGEASASDYRAVAVATTSSAEPGDRTRNATHIDRASMDDAHALGVHELLDSRIASVMSNDVQNNPLQPDLQYRGFTASPLLGSPQGIAVYQNGIRINDPFGDVVAWDLLPALAVQEITLGPSGDPRYGQNALGGALVLRMKNGFDRTGPRATWLGGSFGRSQMSAEHGGVFGENVGVYVGASGFDEDGFREASPSEARHLYSDVRYRSGHSEAGVSLTLARSRLDGNGPAPVELLEREGRSAVFTHPDTTRNSVTAVSADARHELARDIAVSGRAHVRKLLRRTINGDEASFAPCDLASTPSLLCDEEDEPVRDENGDPIPGARSFDALFNTTRTGSTGLGAAAQLEIDRKLAARANHFVLGTSLDTASIDFLQRAQLGELTDDRGVFGNGIYVASDELHTRLRAHDLNVGVYATNTWSIVPRLALTVSGRFQWARAKLDDREGTKLDGTHDFARVNPALGMAYSPSRRLTFFTSYAENNRIPSAAELACADPNAPCRVPNAFVADPPLDQVVSRSLELGARGSFDRRSSAPLTSWSLAAFGSRNQDDILFVAGSRVGTGYFRNAGQTQRVGIEADVSAQLGDVQLYAGYALVRATFESRLDLPGAEHPLASDDVIRVQPGDRMPGIPLHNAKAGLQVAVTPRWEIGISSIARSGHPFRGDEANLLDEVDGFVVLNAETRYALFEYVELVAKAQNLLATRYDTFGVVADASEVLDYASDPRFVSPGAPFGVWAGIVLHEP